MDDAAIADRVRKYFAAYRSGEWSVLEEALADDFTFTSPYDDHIDRATYFERCWPNHERVKTFRLESVMAVGNEAFVLYECEPKSGAKFRNTERFVFEGQKLKSVEVYFGDPPTGVSKQDYARYLTTAAEAWKGKALAQGPNPSKIMQVGTGFFATKTLLSAVELGLFTGLSAGPKTGKQLEAELELHPRGTADFLDALVALGFLTREGPSVTGTYGNTEDTAAFLDRNMPSYIGGMLEMSNHRLYGFWNNLTEALRTGQPQNEIKQGGNLFRELYADERRLEEFMSAMAGVQMGAFTALAEKFDFSAYRTVCDVGGAGGALSTVLARAHQHLAITTFDLPEVAPIATRNLKRAALGHRVTVVSGDFFAGPLPKAEVIVMGNILHDWNLEKKQHLIRSAYASLPKGGALVAVENVIDDDRRLNAFGLLMSLNMLIELGDGFDYTGADFASWAKAAGFEKVVVAPLAGPTSAAIAYK